MMVNFDTLLAEINDFGFYQKLRYLLICIAGLLPPIVTYLHSFTSPNVPHRCKNPFNETDSYSLGKDAFTNLTLEKCVVKIQPNTSFKCDQWVFDKTYYQTSLTEDWGMVCEKTYWRASVQTVYFSGYLVGSLVMGILADHFGRKPIMLSSFILIILGSVGTAFGPQKVYAPLVSYIIYAISRFLIACGTRGINVTGFVLGMEMMGARKRTFAGIVFEYFFGIGQLILVLIAFLIRDWFNLSLVVLIITIPFISYFLFFFLVSFLPESPRWLLSKHRQSDAFEVLKRVAKENKRELKNETWNSLLSEQDLEVKKKTESIVNLKRSIKLIGICAILFLNWMINNLIFYGVGLKGNDLGVSPYLSFAIFAVVEIIACVLSHFILDIFGRKLPYCVFLFLAGVSLFCIVVIDDVRVELILAIIGKFCVSASYAIIYLYSSELFPTSIRNSCMGACSMMARVGSMIAPLVNDLGALAWKDLPFCIFGIFGLIGAASAIVLPETLNRDLPQSIEEADQISKFGLSFKYNKIENQFEENRQGLVLEDMKNNTNAESVEF